MTQLSDRLIQSSGLVVRVATVANRFFFAAVVLGLLLSAIFPARFAMLLIQPGPGTDLRATIIGMRLLMLLGVAMAVAADRLLAALAQIVCEC